MRCFDLILFTLRHSFAVARNHRARVSTGHGALFISFFLFFVHPFHQFRTKMLALSHMNIFFGHVQRTNVMCFVVARTRLTMEYEGDQNDIIH